jgi:hypothetical protein
VGDGSGVGIAHVFDTTNVGLVSGTLNIVQSGGSDTADVDVVNADVGSVTLTQTGNNVTASLTQGTALVDAESVASITQSGNYQDGTFTGTSSNNFTAVLATSGSSLSHAIINAKY